jgi:hypothetical protein
MYKEWNEHKDRADQEVDFIGWNIEIFTADGYSKLEKYNLRQIWVELNSFGSQG